MKATTIVEQEIGQRRHFPFPWLGVAIPLCVLLGLMAYPYLSQRALWPHVRVSPDSSPHPYKHNYRFTTDWFSGHIPVWVSVMRPYQGKPGVHYLEVGTWEGRSLLWT